MPYEFRPRELGEARVERGFHVPPDDALLTAYESWVDAWTQIPRREIGGSISQEVYTLAHRALRDLEFSTDDANAVLVANQDAPPEAGLFLSAAYNLADDDVIFYDVETTNGLTQLGYRLARRKTIVIDAPIHSTIPVGARGLIVNRSEIESFFGYATTGVYINLGQCLAFGTEIAGIHIDLGTVRSRSSSSTRHPTVSYHTDRQPQQVVLRGQDASSASLGEYLIRLRGGLSGDRGSVIEFLAGCKPTPRDAIENDLRSYAPEDQ